MRYLSAHCIYPISSPPLRNGILCVNDEGYVVDVINTGGKLKECEKLEFYNGILVPGFVNAHCHLELSHLRGVIKPHGGLPKFISSIMKNRKVNSEIIDDAAKTANEEMTRNGIVAVGDVSNNNDAIQIKRNSRIRYHTFVEMFGLDNHCARDIFAAAEQTKQEIDNVKLSVSLAPHAIYSVSQALWKTLYQSYSTFPPQVISMHHLETGEEMNHPDKEVFTQMISCFRKASRCLLVHNTFATSNSLTGYVSDLKRFYFVLCPNSNLYIQNRLPDLHLFASGKLFQNVCLGTDSLASNTSLSILEEMKIVQQYAPDIPFEMLLQWATLNGARALGFDDLLGSFEKNKKPGVNLITGIDFEKMRLTGSSMEKMIVSH